MKYRILLWKNKCWESKGSNLGDLAIISATIGALRKELPEAEIILLSDDPDYTTRLYGVLSERIGLRSILVQAMKADLILIGGGTVFTDASSMTIIPINTSIPLLGVLLGKPIATWGIGAGRKSLLGRTLVRLLLPHLRVISVRDKETRDDLSAIFPPAAKLIRVTEDAAFTLRLKGPRPERENRIVIAPRRIFHYKNSFLPFYLRHKLNLLPKGYFEKMEEFKNLLAALADHAVEHHGVTISFLPMYSALGSANGMSGYLKAKFSSRDDVICHDILNRMRHKEYGSVFLTDDPVQVINHLAASRGVVGVPLHSLMLAHVAETPFMGLSYQQKVSRFMRRVGMERFMINVEDMSCPLYFEEFRDKLDGLLAEDEQLAEVISTSNCEFREVVESPAQMIAHLLRTGEMSF